MLKPNHAVESVNAYFDSLLARKRESFLKRYEMSSQHSSSLNDYILIRTIGTGSFGRVVLARKTTSGKVLAIKILKKSQLVMTKQVR